jgi:hypothetical protein
MSVQERKVEDRATPSPEKAEVADPGFTTVLQRSHMSPAQVVALQRTAGNSAVAQLVRAPAAAPLLHRDAIRAKQPDELLVHVLRGAAFRVHEARLVLGGKQGDDAAKRFGAEKADLIAQLDEALLLIAKTPPSRSAFAAASSLFGSATRFVEQAESRAWPGAAALRDKLAELRAALQTHGYKFPEEAVRTGKTEEPRERERGDLVRAVRLGFAAARAALQAGQKKVAAESKAGRSPAVLPGAQEAAVHLKVAGLQLYDISRFETEDWLPVIRGLEQVNDLALALMRQAPGLTGSRALLDEINALNKRMGHDPLMPYGTTTATSGQEATAEQEGKKKAREAITGFERGFTDFAKAERRWEESNFIDYLTKTSSNPRLSWGNSTAFGIFAEALSSAAGTGLVKYLRHRSAKAAAAGGAGAAVGGAIGNAPGAAAGFVIGVLVEYAVTFLLDHLTGKSDIEARAAAAAVTQNNKLIQTQLAKLDEKETEANKATRAAVDHLSKRVDAATATDAPELQAIHADVTESTKSVGNPPAVSDRALMNRFLKAWVLQHAGDENEADTETSDDQWTDARTIAFGKGRSLDNHPEIFAHQTLGHWEGLGLPGIAMTQSMIKEAEAAGANGGDRMMDAYDDRTFEFTKGTRNPDAFIRFVEKGERRKLTDEGKQAIREGRFKLTAKFDLHQYKGAVYIDNWEYELTLIGPSMTQWWEMAKSGRTMGAGAINSAKSRESTVEFDVNPDND